MPFHLEPGRRCNATTSPCSAWIPSPSNTSPVGVIGADAKMSVASARTVPGLPSDSSTTSSNTPFHRLNPEQASNSPNNGCIAAVTRTVARQHRPKMLQSLAITPGTGKTHLLLALGDAAVDAGHRVRYLPAAELVETLYRGLADNSVGRVADTLLRNELIIVDELGFAPLDEPEPNCCSGSWSPPTNAAASAWPHTGPSNPGPLPARHTTAVSMLDRLLHHCHVVATNGTQTVIA